MNEHHFLTTFTGDVLNEKTKTSMTSYVFLRGPVTWKVMPRNVWNDIVS